jgi:hypothetical protein
LVAALAVGFAVPTTAQVGLTFGPGDPLGGLSIGVGGGPDAYKPGRQTLHGVTPGAIGKPAILPKTAPLAPHRLVTNPKLGPHPITGNGVPPAGANTQVKKIETGGTKDHTATTGAPKDDAKLKSDAVAPSPSPTETKALETKKVVTPSPSETPPLADKPKDDSIKQADKPTDAPKTDDGTPPVVVVPMPAPSVETPLAGPPPAGATPPPPPQPNAPETQKAVYSPPAFPEVQELEDCDECQELWESILHYEQIIEQDTDRLAQQQKQVQDLVAERDKFKADLVKAATAADRAYDQQMIQIDDDSITVRTEQNADLQKLIDEETRTLDDRAAQYEQCYDRYCAPPPPVVEVSPSPQPSTVSKEPPTPSPTPTGAAHSPPPEEPHAICGPDITELVFNVLRDMRNDYMNNPDKQTAACHALLDPKTAPSAWDIFQLSPLSAPSSGTQYNPATDDWRPSDPPPTPPSMSTNDTPEEAKAKQDDYEKDLKNYNYQISKPWFTKYSNACAIPRKVCGATVEFLGTCQHAQVVNYVQWGMMMSLCGTGYPTLGKLAHAIWNHMQYNDQAPTDQQNNMVEAGEDLADAIYHDPQNMAGVYNPRLDDIRKKLKEADAKKSHPEQACALECKLTPEQQAQLNENPFGYNWAGLKYSVDSSTRSELGDEAKALIDKALQDAKSKAGR